MIHIKKNINGYILAGGKSSRMGTDKGLLVYNAKTIVQIIIEQLQPAVNNTIIVSKNEAYKKFGLKVITDLINDKGPAGGIHAALSHTDSDKIFVVSCDMPNLTTKAIQFIIEQSLDSQITLPLNDGKVEPLFGVYAKTCLPFWQQLIEQGMIKLQEMVMHFELFKINVENHTFFNNDLFLNINDKNDLLYAQKFLKHGD